MNKQGRSIGALAMIRLDDAGYNGFTVPRDPCLLDDMSVDLLLLNQPIVFQSMRAMTLHVDK